MNISSKTINSHYSEAMRKVAWNNPYHSPAVTLTFSGTLTYIPLLLSSHSDHRNVISDYHLLVAIALGWQSTIIPTTNRLQYNIK
jgi:hypothetical protein